jgi:hypothetical protein
MEGENQAGLMRAAAADPVTFGRYSAKLQHPLAHVAEDTSETSSTRSR